MFILLMIISQCFSYQIKLCNVVSLLDASCNEKCFQITTTNSDLLSLIYSCLNSFSDFIDCLISLGKSIENSLLLAQPCLNSKDLINLQGFSSILQEQPYCLSYFVFESTYRRMENFRTRRRIFRIINKRKLYRRLQS